MVLVTKATRCHRPWISAVVEVELGSQRGARAPRKGWHAIKTREEEFFSLFLRVRIVQMLFTETHGTSWQPTQGSCLDQLKIYIPSKTDVANSTYVCMYVSTPHMDICTGWKEMFVRGYRRWSLHLRFAVKLNFKVKEIFFSCIFPCVVLVAKMKLFPRNLLYGSLGKNVHLHLRPNSDFMVSLIFHLSQLQHQQCESK